MKIPDAQSLVGAVSSCKNVCSLALNNSLVDDDLVRVFFREPHSRFPFSIFLYLKRNVRCSFACLLASLPGCPCGELSLCITSKL